MKKHFFVIFQLAGFLALICPLSPIEASEVIPDSIDIPVDHLKPASGNFSFYFEYASPFDPEKPTVFHLLDGQQFYRRGKTIQGLKDRIFGDRFNLIGVPGRIFSRELAGAVVKDDSSIDWEKAYALYNSFQWCSDIEALRKHILGGQGKVMLYGGSGGGYLIHEFLIHYGKHVSRAFTYGAPNPVLDAEIGVIFDSFYDEIGSIGPEYPDKLKRVLNLFDESRPDLIMALSRQHYFFKADEISGARATLIDSLITGDQDYFQKIKTDYQVNAINDFMSSGMGAAIRVRIYEFIQPILRLVDLRGDRIYPNIEMNYNIALPLLRLREAGRIPSHTMDFSRLGKIDAEVFLLAGNEDKAAGYLSHIELAKKYNRCVLFIAKDDHLFKNLRENNYFSGLVGTFYQSGLDSEEMKDFLKNIGSFHFREGEK
jgi:pimeloyl-ACP methyl ester carboxylesterase